MAFTKLVYRNIAGLCVLLLLAAPLAQAQVFKKSASWLLHHSVIDTTSPGNPSFRIYPTLAYAPETDLEIGLTTLYLFQAKRDTSNRISELNAFSFFTLQNQYGIWLENAIYGHQDQYFVLGRVRYQRFPLLFFGIGPRTSEKDPAVIDANYFIFRQRVLKKIRPNLFLGPDVDYQNFFNTRLEFDNENPMPAPRGSAGSANLGVGGALVFDNRQNVLNVRQGLFAELGLLHYTKALGSTYGFTGVNLDFRSYRAVTKRDVLAWQVTGTFLSGDVPFNQMALMGGEIMMRGYYSGRFRDKNMLATQLEYRMLPFAFSKRIGATVFAGTAVVAPTIHNFRGDNLKVSGGAGLRYLLFPKKDIFVRLDAGITKEGISFYLFTGEAF